MLVCTEKVRTYLHDAKSTNVNNECLSAQSPNALVVLKVTGFWLDQLSKSVLHTVVQVPRKESGTCKKLGGRKCSGFYSDGFKLLQKHLKTGAYLLNTPIAVLGEKGFHCCHRHVCGTRCRTPAPSLAPQMNSHNIHSKGKKKTNVGASLFNERERMMY